jgi:polynucleotide 5'-kinase involved in rRNA processing
MSYNAPIFNASKVCGDTRVLTNELCGLLKCSKLSEVLALVPSMTGTKVGDDDVALTLAFIGQYNAGKSTLIKALTDRDNVTIDADVCTHEVTAYAWHDLRLPTHRVCRLMCQSTTHEPGKPFLRPIW